VSHESVRAPRLPFRDAFDSAFDDVVVIKHLKFKDARRLLDERILRLPVQFQALCHVLSRPATNSSCSSRSSTR